MDRRPGELFLATVGVVGFIITTIGVGDQLLSHLENRDVRGLELLATVIILGMVAWIVQGVSWAAIEFIMGWRFGAGGGTAMPTGLQAVILSLTVTIPILGIPALYEAISGRHVLLENHFSRSVA